MMPITDEAQIEAAVVRPLILKPSRMITPAPRKPTPVTMPWIDARGVAADDGAMAAVPELGIAAQHRQRGRGHADQAVGAHARRAPVIRAFIADQQAQQQRAQQVQQDHAIRRQFGRRPVGAQEVDGRHLILGLFRQLLFKRHIELADAARLLRSQSIDEGDKGVEFQRRAQRRQAGAFGEEKQFIARARHRVEAVAGAFLEPLDGGRGAGRAHQMAPVRCSSHASASPDNSGARRARTVA